MDALQMAAVAGGVASTVAAAANIALVIFLYRQITMQRDFFAAQSRRDARTKISEAWQRHAAELGTHARIAQRLWSADRFWPSAKPEQLGMIVAYVYTLNTLHYEYRFVEEGLHANANFLETLQYYVNTIDDQAELNCLEQMAQAIGFDDAFVRLVHAAILERRGQLSGRAL